MVPLQPATSWWSLVLIGAAYVILTVTVVTIAVDGVRRRNYGMPLFGVIAILGIAFICAFPGPVYHPHLFRRLIEVPALHWAWRGWFVLHLVIFGQYLLYAWRHPRFWPDLRHLVVPLAIALAIAVAYGQWTFIVYHQDVYVNELYALCLLVVASDYMTTLFTRVNLRGLSVPVAWGFLVGNLLLYGGIAMGNMDSSFPCHGGHCVFACSDEEPARVCVVPVECYEKSCTLQLDTGHTFMLFIFGLTITFNLVYAIGLTLRRAELRPDWDWRDTLRRMMPTEVPGRSDE